MCYNIAFGKKQAIKYAKHRGESADIIKQLEFELNNWLILHNTHYKVSGFSHPKLLVFTHDKPYTPQAFYWGLIPQWIHVKSSAYTIRNQTLNARVETIFEKPSFRNSVMNKRCLVYIDAFYEHHHFNGKTFPFHISMKDETPLALAGIWDEWMDEETGEVLQTMSILTTKGNSGMSIIHNNPKLVESRMPAILSKTIQNEWLQPLDPGIAKETLLNLINPLDNALLKYHTVRRLTGKEAMGDLPEAESLFIYPELSKLIL